MLSTMILSWCHQSLPAQAQNYELAQKLRSIPYDPMGESYVRLEDNTLFVNDKDTNDIRVYDLATGRIQRRIDNACSSKYRDDVVKAIVPRGDTLMLWCEAAIQDTVFYVQVVSLSDPSKTLYRVENVARAGLSFDGRRIAHLDPKFETITMLEIGKPPRTYPLGNFLDEGTTYLDNPRFAGDNETILLPFGSTPDDSEGLTAYRFSNGTRLENFDAYGKFSSIGRSPNGVFAVVTYESSIKAFDPRTGSELWSRSTGDASFAGVTPDNQRVIVYSETRNVVLDANNGREIGTLEMPFGDFTADGRYALEYNIEERRIDIYGSDDTNIFLAPFRTVNFTAPPGATIAVNNLVAGRTDDTGLLSVPIPEGEQLVTIRAAGFKSNTYKLRVSKTTADQAPMLERLVARLSFESVPSGATVTLDGKILGTTPLTVNNAEFKAYTYTISSPDYRDSSGTVAPDETAPNAVGRVNLVSKPVIELITTPTAADVYLDGRLIGVTPLIVRDQSAGLFNYSFKKSGYATYSGFLTLKNSGRVTANVKLEVNSGDPVFLGQAQLPSLGLNRNALARAQAELIEVNQAAALPLETLSALTGIGVYGDVRRIQLAIGERKIDVPRRDPRRNQVFVYLSGGRYYVALEALVQIGVGVQRKNGLYVVSFEDDSVNLGAVKRNAWTRDYLDNLTQNWRPAVARSIRVDNQPAFAIRDLVALLPGTVFDADSGKLYRNGQLLARVFVRPSGYTQSLVWLDGSVYVPQSLMPLLGTSARVNGVNLELRVAGAPLTLGYSATGRISTTTSAARAIYERTLARIEADRRAENTRRVKLRKDLEGILARSFTKRYNAIDEFRAAMAGKQLVFKHLGDDYFGTAFTTTSDGGYALSHIVIAYATAANESGWDWCVWTSNPGWRVVSWGVKGGQVVLTAQGPYRRDTVYATYASKNCYVD